MDINIGAPVYPYRSDLNIFLPYRKDSGVLVEKF
jgi:hypothetical protein